MDDKKEEQKPFLMFVSIRDLFMDILKRNSEGEMNFKLGDCFMLIVSRDIISKIGEKSRDFTDTNEFQSRYENVEFLSTLLPKAELIEFVGTTGIDHFAEQYIESLQAEYPMSDIISICDCVANRGKPVFVVFSNSDMTIGYPDVLMDFIHTEFGINIYKASDLVNKPADIIYDIGNIDEIRLAIKEHVNQFLIQYDLDTFFNTLTDDMEKAYRDILSKHTEDELRALAKERYIFVSRRHTKEQIIEKIIEDIKQEGK